MVASVALHVLSLDERLDPLLEVGGLHVDWVRRGSGSPVDVKPLLLRLGYRKIQICRASWIELIGFVLRTNK